MSKVFISYTHEDETHNSKVVALATMLRELGVDVEMDRYTPHPEEGWPTYMIKNVMNSDFTLCICSEEYKNRFERNEKIGIGKGAKFEGKLITQIVYDSEINNKFIPILLDKNYSTETIPIVLKSDTFYNVSNDENFVELYARLTGQEQQKPPLGKVIPIQDLKRRLGVKKPFEKPFNIIRNRCIARFRSNGLDEVVSNRIFNKLIISNRFNYLLPQNRKTNYVVGDFGVGKSLSLDILFLQKIKSQENAFFLSAKEIPIEISLYDFLDVENIKEKTTIFIDGLDEINYNSGKKIIDDIILCETNCNDLYFVVSSRPSILIDNNCSKQQVNLQPLSLNESIELMQQVSENSIPVGIILSWRDELKETLHNPFFAILAGLYFKETNQFMGLSKQAFIKFLIQKSICPLGMDETILNQLEIIATRYINQEQNKILISDLPSNIKIQEVLKTGLIQLENDYIYFSLPIVAQWLAANAIQYGIVDIANLTKNQTDIVKWRYPMMLLMGNCSFEDSKVYFKNIITQYPGLASQILKDNRIMEDIDSLPTADICGEQIAFCLHTWAEGLKDLAKVVIPNDGEKICTFKISVHGSWLYIWWMKNYSGQDYEVVTSPPNEHEYYYSTGTRVGKSSIWPWIVTFNFLTNRMEKFIESKPLFSDLQYLNEEFLYDVARKVLHKGGLYRENISLDELKKNLCKVHKTLSTDLLQAEISRLEKSGHTFLKYPHIQPDRPIMSGWVWNSYSRERTIEYIGTLYKKAVTTYQNLCDNFFVGLCNVMPMRLMLPVTMYIEHIEGEGNYPAPSIRWYFVCKESNKENEIIVNNACGINNLENIHQEIYTSIINYRPTIISLCPNSIHMQLLDIFNENPLNKIIFTWLKDDLKSIGWLD